LNRWLILGGAGSILIALLHLAIIFAGAPAYLYFGAVDLAILAAQGSHRPTIITSFITVTFVIFWTLRAEGRGNTQHQAAFPESRVGLHRLGFSDARPDFVPGFIPNCAWHRLPASPNRLLGSFTCPRTPLCNRD
jgi:hypothetical protein